MMETVRVRFAPSPTGEPHIGNIRTAIFNWFFARRHQGSFIIRIEDTDQTRKIEGTTEGILDVLKWLGIEWDEGPDHGGGFGPYFQSERLHLYQEVVEDLLSRDQAYRCYCSTERLSEMRKQQIQDKMSYLGYDGKCRELRHSDNTDSGKSVVRFKMPLAGEISVEDLIRGKVSFENKLLDDFVIMKSDGFPTYHLANVVDDHYMKISHVMRAEEWLASTPRHIQLYMSMGWIPPMFAHLPIIMAPDRSKLSKRHGATSVMEYRNQGYSPDALVNFLTLLGWSLDDKTDIINVDEIIKNFSIERVNKSSAVFSVDKLNWMNGYYIRQMSYECLVDALLGYWYQNPPPNIPHFPDKLDLLKIVPLIRERLKTFSDAAPLIPFFFQKEIPYKKTDLVQKNMTRENTKKALMLVSQRLNQIDTYDAESIEKSLREIVNELNIKPGQLFGSLRVAITGLEVSPPLFKTMEVLGVKRNLSAIERAITDLGV